MSAPGGVTQKSSFIDDNYRSIADKDGYVDETVEVLDPAVDRDDPKSVNDTLKVSNSRLVVVANKSIHNYNEDCLDLCRVENSSFGDLDLHPTGRNGITIKGASSQIVISARLWSNGSECDVELGQFDNYWYPGRPPTREVALNILGNNHSEVVVVRVWNADRPTLFGLNYDVRVVPKIVWFPYFLFRYAQLRVENVVRRLRGLPLIKTA